MADKFPICDKIRICDGETFIDDMIKEALEKREYAHQESIKNHPKRMANLKEGGEQGKKSYLFYMEHLANLLISAKSQERKEVILRVDPDWLKKEEDCGLFIVSRVVRYGLSDTLVKKGYQFTCVALPGGVYEFVVQL
jgi:hypothetical protein